MGPPWVLPLRSGANFNVTWLVPTKNIRPDRPLSDIVTAPGGDVDRHLVALAQAHVAGIDAADDLRHRPIGGARLDMDRHRLVVLAIEHLDAHRRPLRPDRAAGYLDHILMALHYDARIGGH